MATETSNHRPHYPYSEDFKLSVLTDYYVSGSSLRSIKKKYNLSCGCLQRWLLRYPLTGKSLSLPPETLKRLEAMERKRKEEPAAGSAEARILELEDKVRRLEAALEYSELRVEAFSLAIDYYNKQEGVDILKKAGSRQQ